MNTFDTKTSDDGLKRISPSSQKSVSPSKTDTLPLLSLDDVSPQRQPPCACGGGCPRCQTGTTLQAKLKVGAPNDQYEQEADRIADQVIRMPEPQGQSACVDRRGCAPGQTKQLAQKHQFLQTKRVQTNNDENSVTLPVVNVGLQSPGHPLDSATKAFFEPRFGYDFSQVRVHTDTKSATSAHAINAHAYTVGQDVVFGAGQYEPHTNTGRRLLAHELTHVVQQNSMIGERIQRAEIDDRPEHCEHRMDIAGELDAYVNRVLDGVKGIEDGESRVTAVYEALGKGSPFSVIEEWAEGLHGHLQNRVPIQETRFRGDPLGFGKVNPLFLAGQPLGMRQGSGNINAWAKGERAISTVLKVNNECIGSDKLGHFFQQGHDYFKISVLLGKGDDHAEGFGEWLEGKNSSDPEIQSWIDQMNSDSWPGFATLMGGFSFWKGVFGLSTTGVFSNADLAANTAGMAFYKRVYASPNVTFSSQAYINGNWSEVKNPSCFGKKLAPLIAVNDPEVAKEVADDINKAWREYLLKASNSRQGISIAGKEELNNTIRQILAPHIAKYACR